MRIYFTFFVNPTVFLPPLWHKVGSREILITGDSIELWRGIAFISKHGLSANIGKVNKAKECQK